MCGELEKVLTFNVVNMGLRTKGFEGIEYGPIGAEGSQGPMIADVVQVIVERRGQRGSLWCCWVRLRQSGDDAVALSTELCFFGAGLIGGLLGVRPDSLLVEPTMVGPLDEVTALRVCFVLAFHSNMIRTDSPSTIKKCGGQGPAVREFDLLKDSDGGRLGRVRHTGGFRKNLLYNLL